MGFQRNILSCFKGQQHGNLANNSTEGGAIGVQVTQNTHFHLQKRMVNNCNLHRKRPFLFKNCWSSRRDRSS